MSEITRALIARVGVDLAKQVIQVHGVDRGGRRVVARTLKRDQFAAWAAQLPPGCVVAMEACSSGHHWARRLRAMGLDTRLIAAHFVSGDARRRTRQPVDTSARGGAAVGR